ncbi:rna polymerase sigma factor y : RNA polymerase sigma factor, sigma-70 family OS=Singulisphaera acidiphila (strain ATCC BAA-1392 / DSM 18658 / VKM B-2454 / MOB10) GN=Sinac_1616 PE=4 SV=1: Sigma70_r2 [Gemmata massiliana]|uniref:RNA polymerase sigma-70 region 2 domain-containing protein n=1 Tax=Gemmata massiliana TaxID=1210884 RepID=A0A6P2D403_9BACT|nr:sigma-70 family RNA polymerase sigma factor [Gemmata massiliana]VTR95216.1 rna polymerase sigma factor y : RNA polymerase sigma factor, sigma-70 family OS=Singulisphaera acidiphila (strain ATCC BAA-1392 / DSM 18658 / VKM B-2454 / MOB10) GN=Sinac_1616 PE=4 SV=1: Sigma70_r2 [Gemmata massiliana]
MPRPDDQPADRASTSLTLLQRARAREPGAWDRLWALYGPLVTHWCATARVRPADVEDVRQEVFLSVARALGEFRRDRAGDTFRGWLRTITRNVLSTHFRRGARQPVGAGGSEAQARLHELADPNVELPDEDPPGEVRGVYRRALELVRGEFEEHTWQMFWQNVVEERDAAAVAEQFGVSTAAVRKARSRVLRRLKEEVGDAIE